MMTATAPPSTAPADITGLHLHLTTLIEQLSELGMRASRPPRHSARALVSEAQDAYDQAAREVETFHYPEALESIARAYRVLHLELTPTLKRWRDATTSATERDALDAILADLEAAFGDEEAA
jgi:hypothetical protein